MRRRAGATRIVPEVVQTSTMDCGPACLKSLLGGFGIPVSYGRLREACQTDVDGTSIDTLEEVANQLGLRAAQVMLPPDFLLLDAAEALPALLVVRLPSGLTHLVVAWNKLGGRIQLMDPAAGRLWTRRQSFIDSLYLHEMPVPMETWRESSQSETFASCLRECLQQVGAPSGASERLLAEARGDESGGMVAALDASIRLVRTLVKGRALPRGNAAFALVEDLVRREAQSGCAASLVPRSFWTALALGDWQSADQVTLRGAVLLKVEGVEARVLEVDADTAGNENAAQGPLSPVLVAALKEKPERPLAELFRALRQDGLLSPAMITAATIPAALGVVLEALVFKGLLELPSLLASPLQRLAALAATVVLLFAILMLQWPIGAGLLRLGRRLEMRFQIRFREKIPRLGDRYFHSRLTSDMADRSHAIQALRGVPSVGADMLRLVLVLMFTTAGIGWLDIRALPLALVVSLVCVILPLATQSLLAERDLRVRTHGGALMRYYLDGLRGLVAIRSHGAERFVREEHEALLVEWARSGFSLLRASVLVDVLITTVGLALAVALLFGHTLRAEQAASVLLLLYWSLQLPQLGQQLASTVYAYPSIRSTLLRVLEPLRAPDETPSNAAPADDLEQPASGAAIALDNVTILAGGSEILKDVSLRFSPGEHVAIVGPSGAGKSSLVALLLGWHKAASGSVLVDQCPIETVGYDAVRRSTAWVDPSIALWNRSLIDNLTYGAPPSAVPSLPEVVQASSVRSVLERLPAGLQTELGEAGALVSGGEGQRVRLGRAMMRKHARLVILDEAFRGLEREQRRTLLAGCRRWWSKATLLCVSHDVLDTVAFDRVIVVDGGRVVQDGSPKELLTRPGSYRDLVAAEKNVRDSLWGASLWRRLFVERGKVVDESSREASS